MQDGKVLPDPVRRKPSRQGGAPSVFSLAVSRSLPEPLIDPALAERVVVRALANGGDFAEVFCEERAGFALAIDESRVERAQRGGERGAGVRVASGETTYFAHVDGLAEPDLERAADAAAAALSGERAEPTPLAAAKPAALQEIEMDPADVPAERKAELLRACDERARAAGEAIAQVSGSYAENRRRVTVANSDGRFASDDRTRVRLGVQVVARRDGTVETGFETLGAHRGYELVDGGQGERIAGEAARVALTLLEADPAPAGAMPVVVGRGFGGVLFHEMTGHGLEADHIQKGASVYEGKLGEEVAQSHLVAYDDGVLAGEWGTDAIDDEGTPTQKTTVIDGGRITSYLYDLKSAGKDSTKSTGNGRRESFRHLPIPRMTNTYIAPEPGATPDDLIAGVDRGFYAVSFAGGQVDPTTGDFVFGVSEGYLIEDGKVTSPCRGATLIGNCLAALGRIDAVADDFEMKTGFCGKGGQRVPVGTGQGHVRISELTVGGTAV
jgi:TldD protein